MPYIPDKDKAEMKEAIRDLQLVILTKGELNYAICELVGQLISESESGISYTSMSEWIDAVHDAEQELRRRLLDPYEEIKKVENGDVPSFVGIIDTMNGDR